MKDKRNHYGAVGKSFSEQHFANLPPSPKLCEISKALHPAQPGLTVGRQTQAGRCNSGEFRKF